VPVGTAAPDRPRVDNAMVKAPARVHLSVPAAGPVQKRHRDQLKAKHRALHGHLETADRQEGELLQAGSIRLNVATPGEHLTVAA
jgi:hypothetical protein